MVGTSPAIRSLFESIVRIAAHDIPVLVRGETGSGKERVSRAIHHCSTRTQGPFVAVNCGAIHEGTANSALFGHTRGAFTGALRDRPGAFRLADGGTLFLDEIAELSKELQAALLRVLEVGEVVPLGAGEPVATDARLVTATHRDLREEVRAGRFREDLYYRLAVAHVDVPPLRDRRGDIPILAQHFLFDLASGVPPRLSEGALRALCKHRWPGNVRELRNAILRGIVGAQDGWILADSLALDGQLSLFAPSDAAGDSEDRPDDGAQRTRILSALERASGVRKQAALDLGISRSTLYARMSKLGIG